MQFTVGTFDLLASLVLVSQNSLCRADQRLDPHDPQGCSEWIAGHAHQLVISAVQGAIFTDIHVEGFGMISHALWMMEMHTTCCVHLIMASENESLGTSPFKATASFSSCCGSDRLMTSSFCTLQHYYLAKP